VRCDGGGGARAPYPPPSLLGLGIWVGKVRTYYYSTTLRGRGRTWGTKHRNHNISPGRFWREKSFVWLRMPMYIYSGGRKRKGGGVRDGRMPLRFYYPLHCFIRYFIISNIK